MALVSDVLPPVVAQPESADAAARLYQETTRDMAQQIAHRSVTKRYRIETVSPDDALDRLADAAADLHESHAEIPHGLSCRLSVGLVRIANVRTAYRVAEHLRKDGRFLVTTYHAKDVLERRAYKEAYLDRILDRKAGSPWVSALIEALPELAHRTEDSRLIVVATPVEEVGRDHDFDWAIIEPSSMQSILQTAGRVNRHRLRPIPENQTNVVLLSRNFRDLKDPDKAAFVRPGHEKFDQSAGIRSHPTHDLHELMRPMGQAPESNALDVRAIFDPDNKTLFSACDENAIAMRIEKARKVINREPGYGLHFLMKEYAEAFPLREKRRKISLLLDAKQRKAYFTGDRGEKKSIGMSVASPTQEHVWLSPSLEDLLKKQEASDTLFHADVDEYDLKEFRVDWKGTISEKVVP